MRLLVVPPALAKTKSAGTRADHVSRLSELEVGQTAKIVKVGAVGEIKRRLMEMGLVAGAKVEVERLAPLGDPVEVKVMGYHLSLRKSEAAEIEVKLKN